MCMCVCVHVCVYVCACVCVEYKKWYGGEWGGGQHKMNYPRVRVEQFNSSIALLHTALTLLLHTALTLLLHTAPFVWVWWMRLWFNILFAHTHMHVYTTVHTPSHVHTCTHTYTHAHIHTCTHMHTHAHTCTHTHMCTHHTHTCTHMHIHAYIHTCAHIIHTHAHTCTSYTHHIHNHYTYTHTRHTHTWNVASTSSLAVGGASYVSAGGNVSVFLPDTSATLYGTASPNIVNFQWTRIG